MRIIALSLLALSPLSSSFTYASEIDHAATVSLTSYENIRRVENPEGNELAESVRLSTLWSENTRNFIGEVSAGIESIRFTEEIDDNRNEGDLNANLLWILSPNRYEWALTDVYTHTVIDPRLSDTALNRQYINAFSTGPNINWRLAKTTYIEVQPRIEDYRFENDLLNNQKANTRIEWIQTPSVSTSYGIDVFYETTNYTSSSLADSDYDQKELNFNIGYIRDNLSIQASNGITKIDSNNYDSNNTTQYRLYIKNQRTESSSIELAAGKNVSDTAQAVILSLAIDSNITLSASNDIYTNQYASISYSKSYRNLDLIIDAEKRDEDYFTQNNLDRKVDSGTISLQWINTSNSSFRLGYNMTNADYPLDINQRYDEDRRSSLEYIYRTNKNLSYIISVLDITRDSTEPGESFEDKVLMFSITFATRSRNS